MGDYCNESSNDHHLPDIYQAWEQLLIFNPEVIVERKIVTSDDFKKPWHSKAINNKFCVPTKWGGIDFVNSLPSHIIMD